jgi:hypothetical protein
MPPGGERKGRPGQAYPNRTDMQAGDRQYGDGVNQAAVKSATPNAAPPRGGPVPPAPGQLDGLGAPTQRPDEPVTAGLNVGPGPGAEGLQPGTTHDPALWELRALAQLHPSPDLLRLIAYAEREM